MSLVVMVKSAPSTLRVALITAIGVSLSALAFVIARSYMYPSGVQAATVQELLREPFTVWIYATTGLYVAAICLKTRWVKVFGYIAACFTTGVMVGGIKATMPTDSLLGVFYATVLIGATMSIVGMLTKRSLDKLVVVLALGLVTILVIQVVGLVLQANGITPVTDTPWLALLFVPFPALFIAYVMNGAKHYRSSLQDAQSALYMQGMLFATFVWLLTATTLLSS